MAEAAAGQEGPSAPQGWEAVVREPAASVAAAEIDTRRTLDIYIDRSSRQCCWYTMRSIAPLLHRRGTRSRKERS